MTDADPAKSRTLLLDQQGGVPRITLDNPEAANAISADQRNAIIAQLG